MLAQNPGNFDTLPLNNQPREIRSCCALRQFVNKAPRFLFLSVCHEASMLTDEAFYHRFSAPFLGLLLHQNVGTTWEH